MNCGSANNLRRFSVSEAFRMPPVRYGYQKSATQIDHPYYIKDWSRALWLMYYIHTSHLPMWSWIFRAKKQLGDPHSTDSRFGVWIVIDQVDVRNERHNVFIIQVVLEAKKNNTSPSHHPTALGFFKEFFFRTVWNHTGEWNMCGSNKMLSLLVENIRRLLYYISNQYCVCTVSLQFNIRIIYHKSCIDTRSHIHIVDWYMSTWVHDCILSSKLCMKAWWPLTRQPWPENPDVLLGWRALNRPTSVTRRA